jgi:programmed cell death protein 4
LLTLTLLSFASLVASQGKVRNPSGAGVRAVSSQVQSKAAKAQQQHHHVHTAKEHETKVKEEGSARRNITRKKSDGAATGNYDNRNKKQGGHGKGLWAEHLHDESEHDAITDIDKGDPLYDEEKESYILSSGVDVDIVGYDEVSGKKVVGSMLTLPEFKLRVADILREYFDSADTDEVIRSVEEMKCRAFHPEVVKKAISLSLDEGPRERELVSRLLTCLHPTPLADEDIESGFELLLRSLDDLIIDIPDAKVSRFVCFGITREIRCLPSRGSLHLLYAIIVVVDGRLVLGSCSRR